MSNWDERVTFIYSYCGRIRSIKKLRGFEVKCFKSGRDGVVWLLGARIREGGGGGPPRI